MKLHEIIQEQDLQEGPLLNKIGSAVGKGVGALAKGVGAVAGGIAGLGAAAKKGFQAGKQTVAGAGDEPEASVGGTSAPSDGGQSQTTPSTTPTASTGGSSQAQTTTPAASATSAPPKSNTAFGRLAQAAAGQDPDAPEEKPAAGTATTSTTSAAQTQTGQPADEKPAAGTQSSASTTTATQAQEKPAAQTQEKPEPEQEKPAANDPAFQKMQQNISKLPPEQQKELIAALMADPEVKAKLEQPAVTPAASQDQTQTATTTTATAQATDAKPGRQRDAKGRFIGKNAPRTEPPPSQAEIDADREAKMGPTSDSIIRTGNALSEDLASHVKTVQAMNRGFQRGLANPFAGPGATDNEQDTVASAPTKIVDKTGTMPVELIDRVNNIDNAGKQQLFKFLKARQ